MIGHRLALFALVVGGYLAPDAPRFLVTTTAGPLEGTLRTLTAGGEVELQGKELGKVGPEKWYALRRQGEPLLPLPQGLHVVLTNGDRIPVTRPRFDGDKLIFTHPDLGGGKETALSLGAVALIWWAAPAQAEGEVIRRRLLRDSRKEDVALLRNGDRVAGVPAGLDANRLTLQAEGGNRALDLKQMACLALNTELAEKLQPPGRSYQMTFRGAEGRESMRVSLATLTSDGETIGGKTVFGATVRIPLGRLLLVEVVGGPVVPLTDLKPVGTTQEPYLDWRWPVGIDSTATDTDLRLGSDTHLRGLGLAAGNRVTFRIDGKYRRFTAVVGLDPKLGRAGGVRLEVLADGKPVSLPQAELIGSGETLPLSLDITGVKELTLGVQPGRRGAVQGHVNWTETWLVK